MVLHDLIVDWFEQHPEYGMYACTDITGFKRSPLLHVIWLFGVYDVAYVRDDHIYYRKEQTKLMANDPLFFAKLEKILIRHRKWLT